MPVIVGFGIIFLDSDICSFHVAPLMAPMCESGLYGINRQGGDGEWRRKIDGGSVSLLR